MPTEEPTPMPGRPAPAAASADVVVAGGGVIGASVAYHLVAEGRPGAPGGGRPGRVVVVERDPTFERASFARATGGVRQQFGHPANVAMARHSVSVYERFADLLAVEGVPGACGLVQTGYLFLADDRNGPALLRRYEANRAAGVEVERLDQVGILMRVPDMDVGGIRFGILGRRDGRVDPRAIQESFERAARHLGAEWVADEVVGLEVDGGRVSGVRLASGGRIATRAVVNACGAWAARLGASAGAPVPVEPVRRQLYVVEPPAPLSETEVPMVIDPTGVHFRADAGGTLRVGEGPDGGLPASLDGPIPYDEGRFDAAVRPRLARRVPPLGKARLLRGWAGLYEVTPDGNALLGEHPDLPGLLLATGFSGHGVMMAPAAGFALAELVRSGRSTKLDIAPFRLARFAEGEPIVEEGVL